MVVPVAMADTDDNSNKRNRSGNEQAILRDHFMAWQCHVRQYAARHEEGRPSIGMRPRLFVSSQELTRITLLINRRELREVTGEFRHMVMRTADPAEQFKAAVRMLSELYYQQPRDFSEVMTALFSAGSSIVSQLTAVGQCEFEFDFQNQYYRIPYAVQRLEEPDPVYQSTYWHNRLFNRAMPGGVQVLAFTPDWAHATANPLPNLLASDRQS